MIDSFSEVDVSFNGCVEKEFLLKSAEAFSKGREEEFEKAEKKLKSMIDLDLVRTDLLIEMRVALARRIDKVSKDWNGMGGFNPL
jgi:hypothetical protein